MSSSADMQTSLFPARSGSKSLKTTVPDTYVNMLKLKPGDKLEWDHEIVNNEIIVKVRKSKK